MDPPPGKWAISPGGAGGYGNTEGNQVRESKYKTISPPHIFAQFK